VTEQILNGLLYWNSRLESCSEHIHIYLYCPVYYINSVTLCIRGKNSKHNA